MTQRVQTAAGALKDAALRTGDKRLLALATNLAEPKSVKTKFDPIIKAIDKMITLLEKEEDEDLAIKQTCEKDRMEDTREAIVTSRDIDEDTELITKLTEQIAKCEKKIEELVAEHKKTKEELDKAQRMRDDENAAWKKTDA